MNPIKTYLDRRKARKRAREAEKDYFGMADRVMKNPINHTAQDFVRVILYGRSIMELAYRARDRKLAVRVQNRNITLGQLGRDVAIFQQALRND